jgi:hypothetical protein
MTSLTGAKHFGASIATENSLQNLQIASPCPSDWNKMVGNEQVRHCSECNLNVYNLSAMTERQVSELVAGHQGKRLCARLYRRADGTILTQECPWRWRTLKRRASRLAGAVLTAMMSVSFAISKNKAPQPACECQQAAAKEPAIALMVMDKDDAVIQNAEITLENSSRKEHFTGRTGNSGQWSLSRLHPGKYTLTVRSPGFKPFRQIIKVQDGHVAELKITLPISATDVTVRVEAPGVEVMGTMVGIVTAEKPSATLPSGAGGQRLPMRQ